MSLIYVEFQKTEMWIRVEGNENRENTYTPTDRPERSATTEENVQKQEQQQREWGRRGTGEKERDAVGGGRSSARSCRGCKQIGRRVNVTCLTRAFGVCREKVLQPVRVK